MNVVLYGATGHAGSRILAELLRRGIAVTAITRAPQSLPAEKNLTIRQGDLSDVQSIAQAIQGTDAVISAYAPPPDQPNDLVAVTDRLIAAVEKVGHSGQGPRLIVVGGAGSLEVAPGVMLVNTPGFPEAWKGIAQAHVTTLEHLRASSIDWTYLSPSAFFEPGQRTGVFRLGQDALLTDAQGKSWISMEDYAIALVDELERGQHHRQRFTVGY